MYLAHWNLTHRPFDERAGPAWFYASGSHQAALASLQNAVRQRASTVLLVGGAGNGKSIITAVLADTLCRDRHLIVRFASGPSTADGSLAAMLWNLQQPALEDAPLPTVPCAAGAARGQLQDVLKQLVDRGRHPVVVLDAAEYLEDSQLDELVLAVHGLTVHGVHALTVVLVGPTELLVRARRFLRTPQPLPPQCLVKAMLPHETVRYLRHRLSLAGGNPSIFTGSAIELIHELAGGVPRRINRLCDLSLLVAYGMGAEQVEPTHIRCAQTELHTLGSTRTAISPTRHRWKTPPPPRQRSRATGRVP